MANKPKIEKFYIRFANIAAIYPVDDDRIRIHLVGNIRPLDIAYISTVVRDKNLKAYKTSILAGDPGVLTWCRIAGRNELPIQEQ